MSPVLYATARGEAAAGGGASTTSPPSATSFLTTRDAARRSGSDEVWLGVDLAMYSSMRHFGRLPTSVPIHCMHTGVWSLVAVCAQRSREYSCLRPWIGRLLGTQR